LDNIRTLKTQWKNTIYIYIYIISKKWLTDIDVGDDTMTNIDAHNSIFRTLQEIEHQLVHTHACMCARTQTPIIWKQNSYTQHKRKKPIH
jgi:hypothetical protein